MEDYLSKLNPQQRQAVTYCDGPQLVIAGAGSGKTRVLTYKIVHLLAHGYEPWRILALTFTNKAAREMRERIEALVGEKTASRLWMGTFHSIFLRILRVNADRIGFRSNFTIYDTADSKSLIKTIIRDMELDDKVYKPSTVMNSISMAKNALISPTAYANDKDIRDADRRAKRDRTYEIYAGYVNRCHVAGAMDFDDLLYYTNVLLRDNPDILHHYREFFRYVLVDEYQDTNFAQHLIVSQICKESQALCVVGDDAQSIYSFRGANIRNILNLRKAYPNLQIDKLEQNYRSTQNIINAANSLIEKNREQIRKHVFSKNDVGDKIEVVKSFSGYEEAYLVANRISQRHMQTGDAYEDFAILYRTNAQSRVLEEALRKRNIPYRIYGGMSFYQRKEVKDAIAYFRLAINPNDDEALRRIINYPARGIGDTTVRKLISAAIDNGVSIWQVALDTEAYNVGLRGAAKSRIGEFTSMLSKFINMNAAGADALKLAQTIISDTRLLSVLVSDSTPESISKQENLQELLNGVQEFVTDRQEEGDDENILMTDFLSEVSLATDQDEDDDEKTAKVTLMTIHAAKGLEFGNVFIVGVEEDLMPSAMSNNSPAEIEEERRLLYVAITRAKRFCMMSYAGSRFRNGSTDPTYPSRFLRDIDSRYTKYTLGSDLSTFDQSEADMFSDSFHSSRRPSRPSWYGAKSANGRQRPSTSIYTARHTDSAPTHSPSVSASAISPTQTPAASNTSADGFASHPVSELHEGMRIVHSRFGNGTITEIDTSAADAKIKVKFENVEIKTLLLRYAKFKIL